VTAARDLLANLLLRPVRTRTFNRGTTMRIPKLVVAGALLGATVGLLRVYLRHLSEAPLQAGGTAILDEHEPVLGYDGMDVDTLLTWLADAGLDRETLSRMRDYEAQHLGREAVLAELDSRL
jgi:hypothetical protein